MIDWLDSPIHFPNPELALKDPNGLLAAGGDLHPDTLLNAYKKGIFPWFSESDPILWWSPNPRMVLNTQHLHISKSMQKLFNKQHFTVTCDKAFTSVINHCAGIRSYADSTWISDDIKQGYLGLHQLGYAHSIEVWHNDILVGGLYGVAIGTLFFGESMFSHKTNASKYGFITLCKALEQSGFSHIDCQVYSDHLASLGAREIARRDFLALLNSNIQQMPKQSPWAIINT